MNIRNIILKKYLIKRFSVVEAIEKFYPKKRVYLKKEVDKEIVDQKFKSFEKLLKDEKYDIALNDIYENSLDIIFLNNKKDLFKMYYMIGKIHMKMYEIEEAVCNFELALKYLVDYDNYELEDILKEIVTFYLKNNINSDYMIDISIKHLKPPNNYKIFLDFVILMEKSQAIEFLLKIVSKVEDNNMLGIFYYKIAELTKDNNYSIKANKYFNKDISSIYLKYYIQNNFYLSSNSSNEYIYKNEGLCDKLKANNYIEELEIGKIKIEDLRLKYISCSNSEEKIELLLNQMSIIKNFNLNFHTDDKDFLDNYLRAIMIDLSNTNKISKILDLYLSIHFNNCYKEKSENSIKSDLTIFDNLINISSPVDLTKIEDSICKCVEIIDKNLNAKFRYNCLLLMIFLRKKNYKKFFKLSREINKLIKNNSIDDNQVNSFSIFYFALCQMRIADIKLIYLEKIFSSIKIFKRNKKFYNKYIDQHIEKRLSFVDRVSYDHSSFHAEYNIISTRFYILLKKYHIQDPDVNKEFLLEAIKNTREYYNKFNLIDKTLICSNIIRELENIK